MIAIARKLLGSRREANFFSYKNGAQFSMSRQQYARFPKLKYHNYSNLTIENI